MQTDYGQPLDGIFQYAYVVEDIGRAMAEQSDLLGVGPWFLTDPFTPTRARYRGKPTTLTVQLSFVFAGHVMIELIQQHDEAPSVMREIVDKRGYGFHHYGVNTSDFEASCARMQALGYEEAYFDVFDDVRVTYFDTTDRLPGMTEFVELSPGWEALQTAMWSATRGWHGKDPVRPFASLLGG